MKRRIIAIVFVLLFCIMNTFTIFASGDYGSVVDGADLLTPAEEDDLASTLHEICNRQKVDLVVVTMTTADLAESGRTKVEYADDFYDYNGYGYGEEHDGALLLIVINPDTRKGEWYISTCGYGITALTDAKISAIGDKMVPDLKSYNYASAFKTFAKQCDRYIDEAHDAGKIKPIWVPMAILFGAFLGFLAVSAMKASMKSVRYKAAAKDYVRQGSFNLTGQRDIFLYTNVTSTPKPKESSGSSTHTSSSGTSHGGGGGSF